MEIEWLPGEFTVCRLPDGFKPDLSMGFCFFARTGVETSLVCRTEDVPGDASRREDGWKCFRFCGTLDFSLTGVLSRVSGILAEKGIGIFAVSTYDTDYILVKKENFKSACGALSENGYSIRNKELE